MLHHTGLVSEVQCAVVGVRQGGVSVRSIASCCCGSFGRFVTRGLAVLVCLLSPQAVTPSFALEETWRGFIKVLVWLVTKKRELKAASRMSTRVTDGATGTTGRGNEIAGVEGNAESKSEVVESDSKEAPQQTPISPAPVEAPSSMKQLTMVIRRRARLLLRLNPSIVAFQHALGGMSVASNSTAMMGGSTDANGTSSGDGGAPAAASPLVPHTTGDGAVGVTTSDGIGDAVDVALPPNLPAMPIKLARSTSTSSATGHPHDPSTTATGVATGLSGAGNESGLLLNPEGTGSAGVNLDMVDGKSQLRSTWGHILPPASVRPLLQRWRSNPTSEASGMEAVPYVGDDGSSLAQGLDALHTVRVPARGARVFALAWRVGCPRA